jgi:hypothetical protein
VELLVLAFFCGLSAGTIGKIKGSSFLIWFLIGFVLPILGTIAALLYRYDREAPRRTCPVCGHEQGLEVQVCRCGADLLFPEVQGREHPA